VFPPLFVRQSRFVPVVPGSKKLCGKAPDRRKTWRRAVTVTLVKPRQKAVASEGRLAPDALSAVLPALAALGAVASIAAIAWAGQDASGPRARPQRKPDMALRDLEGCCMGLEEIFKRLKRSPRLFTGVGGAAASPLKFGVHGMRVDANEARTYQQLITDVASVLVLASQNSYDVMAAVEDGDINAPEELFYRFGAEQERLNALLLSRAPLLATVDMGLQIAAALTAIVRDLKRYRVRQPAA
jgi:hypothetical protein